MTNIFSGRLHLEIVIADLARFLTIKQGLSTTTVHHVTGRFNTFEKWANSNEISHKYTKDKIEEFLYSLKIQGLRNNSINSYIFTFKELYAYFQDRGIETENFIDGLHILPKNPRPIVILTPSEIEALINVEVPYGKFRNYTAEEVTEGNNALYKTFTRFLAHTGARFSEAADLIVRNIDLSAGTVVFVDTKNKTNRSAWITEPLIGEIRRLIQGKGLDGRVFTNFVGSRVIAVNYGFHLRKACQITGITKRVHPHIFRHSFATQLLMSGVDVTMVASILGHKDIQTTFQNYVHLADDSLRKSVYRHPLIRKNIDPKEILRIIKESIESLKIDTDERFDYTINEGSNCLQFNMKIK